MRADLERIRREHLPEERYSVRREAEAAARDLIQAKLGRLEPADVSELAKLLNRDISRYGMPFASRWGLGLSQPQVNNLNRNLALTNRVVRQLWEAPEAQAIAAYEELRKERAPGGDMLASLVLYLRDPSNFAVFVPSLERGARNLGIVQSEVPVSYREFNKSVQEWRNSYGVDPVEADVILTVSDPRRQPTPQTTTPNPIREALEAILADYLDAKSSQTFGSNAPIWTVFEQLGLELERTPPVSDVETLAVKASPGVGNWANVPWVAIFDNRVTRSIRDGVYCVYLFRRDMSGVYLTLNQGVEEPFKRLGRDQGKVFLANRAAEIRQSASALSEAGFQLDNNIELRSAPGLGTDYELSTIAHKFYATGQIPDDAALTADLNALVAGYLKFVEQENPPHRAEQSRDVEEGHDWDTRESELERAVQATGFVFEPWQLAAFTTAMRTKPFVILAGVTGTGKTQLPLLVARLTGGSSSVIAVRPDWTDSGDLLGYTDLAEKFRPGQLLTRARDASADLTRLHLCVLDEMNIGRVEHYLAEVLSAMERRTSSAGGGYESAVLMPSAPDEWGLQSLPPNFVLVGTVNMDESAHGFSRKVIDRAFTLELSDVDLNRVSSATDAQAAGRWPANAWYPVAIRLGESAQLDRQYVGVVIGALTEINRHLAGAQLQVGYRSRDEIALFGIHARQIEDHFVTRDGDEVSPLDLAIMMKVLPRILGGSVATRRCLLGLLGWAHGAAEVRSDDDARTAVKAWETAGRPSAIADVPYPRTAARLCLMWERLDADGFASYWL
jgi:hypothetical protein